MTLQKLRRWLGFPLEDRYRVHIEQDIVQSSLRPGIFSALLILAFQAVMMVLSLLRKGGPFCEGTRNIEVGTRNIKLTTLDKGRQRLILARRKRDK